MSSIDGKSLTIDLCKEMNSHNLFEWANKTRQCIYYTTNGRKSSSVLFCL